VRRERGARQAMSRCLHGQSFPGAETTARSGAGRSRSRDV
jgi:hypothetical protein